MKKVMLVVGVVFAALIVIVILLPFLVNLNHYQARYLPIIEESLNRKVVLKDIRLTIFPSIGVRLSGLTVMEDPAFGAGPFASLSALDVGVKLRPLLNRRIEVSGMTLRDPIITMIKNSRGVTNTSTLGPKVAAKPEQQAEKPSPAQGPLHILTLFAVDRIAITGGKLTYRDELATKPSESVLQNLDLLLKDIGLNRTPSIHMATTLQPQNLPIKVDGTAGPLKETLDIETIDLLIMLGKIALTVKGSDIDGDLKLSITSPTINTADLPVALPLKKPVEAKDLKVSAEVKGPQTKLPNLSFNLFGGQVTAQGGLTTGTPAPPFQGKVAVQGVQLGPVLEAVGTDKVSVTGTAAVDLDLRGAGFSMPELTNALEGPGHAVVKDGKIEGVNLLREAAALLNAVGIKQDLANATVFSTMEMNIAIKRGIIRVERLLMDSHDFQTSANGTIGFDKTLNLRANLLLSEALSKSIFGSSPTAKLAMTGGRMTVPMVITGTTAAPSYGLDSKAIGAKVQEQVTEKAKEQLGEILKGKGTSPEGKKGKDLLKGLFGQ
ncbi:MAG: AsmA family protein [Nitrospirae bacterium]|nr:MAG: AsmA family protein [Nitrospirota bacterium]